MTNREFFLKTWQNEMKITAGAVRALPKDMSKLEYKPDPKSRTAYEIICHMLPHAEAMAGATETFVMNESDKKYTGPDEAADEFEKNAARIVENLNKIDDKTWEEKVVPFVYEGTKYFEYPMYSMFWMFMNDIIHHRGQLSTYYRSMGVRNPSIYGPTADDE